MASDLGSGNNKSNYDNPTFVMIENDPPPNMNARFMMLIEKMAMSNECQEAMQSQIAALMARKNPSPPPEQGRPNTVTLIVF